MGQIPFKKVKKPERLISYWAAQWPLCLLITITGFLYNFGMLVSPYFEGRIVDSIEAQQSLNDVLILLAIFIGSILVVFWPGSPSVTPSAALPITRPSRCVSFWRTISSIGRAGRRIRLDWQRSQQTHFRC
jgi:hypothetical protein